jgi:hypothetical protein
MFQNITLILRVLYRKAILEYMNIETQPKTLQDIIVTLKNTVFPSSEIYDGLQAVCLATTDKRRRT